MGGRSVGETFWLLGLGARRSKFPSKVENQAEQEWEVELLQYLGDFRDARAHANIMSHKYIQYNR